MMGQKMEATSSMVKWVYSLERKKNRYAERCFTAEGTKCVLDMLGAFKARHVFATAEWAQRHSDVECLSATEIQLGRMSALKTPSDVIAVFEMPEMAEPEQLPRDLYLVLDDVQDPGNLGTIIRIADWFGIRRIFCSRGTADAYNPKTVQATMGALARVAVHYADLPELFAKHRGMPVYGTFLDGEDIYNDSLGDCGFIVFGNEGNGISPELEPFMSKRLLIPSYPSNVATSESLNVGMAAAITIGEFRRRMR